mmetsp:Transcript_44666/g.149068  ORF Transcript_44666/g.149068 Transcript_44666/m.149068 type:complete len:252 (-) Transcript_44666:2177-2932(-)
MAGRSSSCARSGSARRRANAFGVRVSVPPCKKVRSACSRKVREASRAEKAARPSTRTRVAGRRCRLLFESSRVESSSSDTSAASTTTGTSGGSYLHSGKAVCRAGAESGAPSAGPGAPPRRIKRAHSLCPRRPAHSAAVRPRHTVRRLQETASNICTTDTCPCTLASTSGVAPLPKRRSGASTSALCLSSSSTAGARPAAAATAKSGRPSCPRPRAETWPSVSSCSKAPTCPPCAAKAATSSARLALRRSA